MGWTYNKKMFVRVAFTFKSLFLFLGLFISVNTYARLGPTTVANAGTAAGSAINAEESLKHKKKCKAYQQAQQMQKAKEECKKSDANAGQMLGNLGQLLQGLMSQKNQSSPEAQNTPQFAALSGIEQFEEPTDIFKDQEKARAILEGSGLSSAQARTISNAVSLADAAGVDFDEDTGNITTSSGDISAASLGSPAGLAALGFTPEEIKDKAIKQAALAKELISQYKSIDLSSGGGGGGGGSSGSSGLDNFDFDLPEFPKLQDHSNSLANQLGRKPSSVLSRNFGGDRIGIPNSNIFESISRRYRIKARSNAFLP